MRNKKSVLILATFALSNINFMAQSDNSIVFTHDQAGNITQRKLQVQIGSRIGNPSIKDSSEVIPLTNFRIFPNPTNQYLNIEGDLPENVDQAKVRLLTISGQVLLNELYIQNQSKQIDVSYLKNGIYLLEILYSERKRSTYKVIVTK